MPVLGDRNLGFPRGTEPCVEQGLLGTASPRQPCGHPCRRQPSPSGISLRESSVVISRVKLPWSNREHHESHCGGLIADHGDLESYWHWRSQRLTSKTGHHRQNCGIALGRSPYGLWYSLCLDCAW